MKIGLVSLDQAWEDKAANMQACAVAAERAAAAGCAAILLPELTLTGFSMNTQAIAEDLEKSSSMQFYCQLAKLHRLAVFGGLALRSSGRVANSLVVVSKTGRLLGRYAKLHPFSFADEDKHFAPGDALVTVELGGWSIGLSICYDLRFPEMFSVLARKCAVIVNIANWPETRLEHWDVLLRARAIENQVFVVGVNRTGTDGEGLRYRESSQVIDANGSVLPPLMQNGDLKVYELDRAAHEKYLAGFPTRPDSRPRVYRKFYGHR